MAPQRRTPQPLPADEGRQVWLPELAPPLGTAGPRQPSSVLASDDLTPPPEALSDRDDSRDPAPPHPGTPETLEVSRIASTGSVLVAVEAALIAQAESGRIGDPASLTPFLSERALMSSCNSARRGRLSSQLAEGQHGSQVCTLTALWKAALWADGVRERAAQAGNAPDDTIRHIAEHQQEQQPRGAGRPRSRPRSRPAPRGSAPRASGSTPVSSTEEGRTP